MFKVILIVYFTSNVIIWVKTHTLDTKLKLKCIFLFIIYSLFKYKYIKT